MHREIRRKDREISAEKALKILEKCLHGVLSTSDADNQPYGVPLSYVVYNNSIYFHSAKTGHKISNIQNNDKVSFCVIGDAPVDPEKFTVNYESVIVFGKISEVVEESEKINSCRAFCNKYSSDFQEEIERRLMYSLKTINMYKISIDHISGKANYAKNN